MATSGNEWYNEWKRMKLMRASEREWLWFQNQTKYAIYISTIFSAIKINYIKIPFYI